MPPEMSTETSAYSFFTKRRRDQKGGWICFPFITGAAALLTLGTAGWTANLIVYLTEKFGISSVDAAEISSVINGCINLLPLIAAIIADSFIGCFLVASISSAISFLGVVLLSLTATVDSLRPNINSCPTPPCTALASKAQLAVLYTSLTLASLGAAGTWFTLANIGADQFDKPNHQATFFNWYLFAKYTGFVVGNTVFVYVQDIVSWGLGFGLCAVANLVGTLILVLGSRFYRLQKPEGSPFTSLAQVVVAAVKKRRLLLTSNPRDYYNGRHHHHQVGGEDSVAALPKQSFRFFNRAALKTQVDTTTTDSSGSGSGSGSGTQRAKSWSLCTVRQVEDLKTLIRVIPLWSSSIFLSTPIAVQNSVTVLQALAMDRHLGPDFTIPAGSVLVVVMISGCVSIALIERLLNPMLLKITNPKYPTLSPLKRVGIGHVLNVLSMAVSALVESKRLHSRGNISVLWLFPQLILVGTGEAFHFPGQVDFYYQEFPATLKTSAVAMVAMTIGTAFYLSTAVVDESRRLGWLKDDLNKGRLDIAYWMLVVVGVANFGYFLLCAVLYICQPLEMEEKEEGDDQTTAKLPVVG